METAVDIQPLDANAANRHALQNWILNECDILPSRALTYASLLIEQGIASINRLLKRVLREPDFLLKLIVDPDDRDEITFALGKITALTGSNVDNNLNDHFAPVTIPSIIDSLSDPSPRANLSSEWENNNQLTILQAEKTPISRKETNHEMMSNVYKADRHSPKNHEENTTASLNDGQVNLSSAKIKSYHVEDSAMDEKEETRFSRGGEWSRIASSDAALSNDAMSLKDIVGLESDIMATPIKATSQIARAADVTTLNDEPNIISGIKRSKTASFFNKTSTTSVNSEAAKKSEKKHFYSKFIPQWSFLKDKPILENSDIKIEPKLIVQPPDTLSAEILPSDSNFSSTSSRLQEHNEAMPVIIIPRRVTTGGFNYNNNLHSEPVEEKSSLSISGKSLLFSLKNHESLVTDYDKNDKISMKKSFSINKIFEEPFKNKSNPQILVEEIRDRLKNTTVSNEIEVARSFSKSNLFSDRSLNTATSSGNQVVWFLLRDFDALLVSSVQDSSSSDAISAFKCLETGLQSENGESLRTIVAKTKVPEDISKLLLKFSDNCFVLCAAVAAVCRLCVKEDDKLPFYSSERIVDGAAVIPFGVPATLTAMYSGLCSCSKWYSNARNKSQTILSNLIDGNYCEKDDGPDIKDIAMLTQLFIRFAGIISSNANCASDIVDRGIYSQMLQLAIDLSDQQNITLEICWAIRCIASSYVGSSKKLSVELDLTCECLITSLKTGVIPVCALAARAIVILCALEFSFCNRLLKNGVIRLLCPLFSYESIDSLYVKWICMSLCGLLLKSKFGRRNSKIPLNLSCELTNFGDSNIRESKFCDDAEGVNTVYMGDFEDEITCQILESGLCDKIIKSLLESGMQNPQAAELLCNLVQLLSLKDNVKIELGRHGVCSAIIAIIAKYGLQSPSCLGVLRRGGNALGILCSDNESNQNELFEGGGHIILNEILRILGGSTLPKSDASSLELQTLLLEAELATIQICWALKKLIMHDLARREVINHGFLDVLISVVFKFSGNKDITHQCLKALVVLVTREQRKNSNISNIFLAVKDSVHIIVTSSLKCIHDPRTMRFALILFAVLSCSFNESSAINDPSQQPGRLHSSHFHSTSYPTVQDALLRQEVPHFIFACMDKHSRTDSVIAEFGCRCAYSLTIGQVISEKKLLPFNILSEPSLLTILQSSNNFIDENSFPENRARNDFLLKSDLSFLTYKYSPSQNLTDYVDIEDAFASNPYVVFGLSKTHPFGSQKLLNLCSVNTINSGILLKAGILRCLGEVLKSHGLENEVIAVWAVRAICNLCTPAFQLNDRGDLLMCRDDNNKSRHAYIESDIQSFSILDSLIVMLRKYLNNGIAFCQYFCECIYQLSAFNSLSSSFGSLGACDDVIGILFKYQDHPTVFRAALLAIGGLARLSDENRLRFSTSVPRIADVILSVLKNYRNNNDHSGYGLEEDAFYALAYIHQFNHNRSATGHYPSPFNTFSDLTLLNDILSDILQWNSNNMDICLACFYFLKQFLFLGYHDFLLINDGSILKLIINILQRRADLLCGCVETAEVRMRILLESTGDDDDDIIGSNHKQSPLALQEGSATSNSTSHLGIMQYFGIKYNDLWFQRASGSFSVISTGCQLIQQIMEGHFHRDIKPDADYSNQILTRNFLSDNGICELLCLVINSGMCDSLCINSDNLNNRIDLSTLYFDKFSSSLKLSSEYKILMGPQTAFSTLSAVIHDESDCVISRSALYALIALNSLLKFRVSHKKPISIQKNIVASLLRAKLGASLISILRSFPTSLNFAISRLALNTLSLLQFESFKSIYQDSVDEECLSLFKTQLNDVETVRTILEILPVNSDTFFKSVKIASASNNFCDKENEDVPISISITVCNCAVASFGFRPSLRISSQCLLQASAFDYLINLLQVSKQIKSAHMQVAVCQAIVSVSHELHCWNKHVPAEMILDLLSRKSLSSYDATASAIQCIISLCGGLAPNLSTSVEHCGENDSVLNSFVRSIFDPAPNLDTTFDNGTLNYMMSSGRACLKLSRTFSRLTMNYNTSIDLKQLRAIYWCLCGMAVLCKDTANCTKILNADVLNGIVSVLRIPIRASVIHDTQDLETDINFNFATMVESAVNNICMGSSGINFNRCSILIEAVGRFILAAVIRKYDLKIVNGFDEIVKLVEPNSLHVELLSSKSTTSTFQLLRAGLTSAIRGGSNSYFIEENVDKFIKYNIHILLLRVIKNHAYLPPVEIYGCCLCLYVLLGLQTADTIAKGHRGVHNQIFVEFSDLRDLSQSLLGILDKYSSLSAAIIRVTYRLIGIIARFDNDGVFATDLFDFGINDIIFKAINTYIDDMCTIRHIMFALCGLVEKGHHLRKPKCTGILKHHLFKILRLYGDKDRTIIVSCMRCIYFIVGAATTVISSVDLGYHEPGCEQLSSDFQYLSAISTIINVLEYYCLDKNYSKTSKPKILVADVDIAVIGILSISSLLRQWSDDIDTASASDSVSEDSAIQILTFILRILRCFDGISNEGSEQLAAAGCLALHNAFKISTIKASICNEWNDYAEILVESCRFHKYSEDVVLNSFYVMSLILNPVKSGGPSTGVGGASVNDLSTQKAAVSLCRAGACPTVLCTLDRLRRNQDIVVVALDVYFGLLAVAYSTNDPLAVDICRDVLFSIAGIRSILRFADAKSNRAVLISLCKIMIFLCCDNLMGMEFQQLMLDHHIAVFIFTILTIYRQDIFMMKCACLVVSFLAHGSVKNRDKLGGAGVCEALCEISIDLGQLSWCFMLAATNLTCSHSKNISKFNCEKIVDILKTVKSNVEPIDGRLIISDIMGPLGMAILTNLPDLASFDLLKLCSLTICNITNADMKTSIGVVFAEEQNPTYSLFDAANISEKIYRANLNQFYACGICEIIFEILNSDEPRNILDCLRICRVLCADVVIVKKFLSINLLQTLQNLSSTNKVNSSMTEENVLEKQPVNNANNVAARILVEETDEIQSLVSSIISLLNHDS